MQKVILIITLKKYLKNTNWTVGQRYDWANPIATSWRRESERLHAQPERNTNRADKDPRHGGGIKSTDT